jgi:hypothetical protein
LGTKFPDIEFKILLQDNAGVIVNPKGEMKGSAITGPVAKECVRILPPSCLFSPFFLEPPSSFPLDLHSSLSFVSLIFQAIILPYDTDALQFNRQTYGRVSHQTPEQWSSSKDIGFDFSFSISHNMCPCIPMNYDEPTHAHAYSVRL